MNNKLTTNGITLLTNVNKDTKIKDIFVKLKLIAVEEFLINNKNWELCMRYTHNNGLTVLKRNKKK